MAYENSSDLSRAQAALGVYIDNTLAGKLSGYSWGIQKLDTASGRIEPGQITVIGGASGVGKSYFMGNIIHRLQMQYPDLKVAVFTSELDRQTYIRRQAFLAAGIWKSSFENYPHQYADKFREAVAELVTNATARNNFWIFGPVYDFAEVLKNVQDNKPDIVFIDYIQQFYYGKDRKIIDAMPVIAELLQQSSKLLNIPFVVLSQVSNYSTKESRDTSIAAPFDYGKELNNAAHRSIVIEREKKEGKLSDKLKVSIHKSRDGEVGYFEMQILPGYKLQEIIE